MERYITNEIYNKHIPETSGGLLLEINSFCSYLASQLNEDTYLQIEERLYEIFTKLEQEGFHSGFQEGIRFLLKCV